MTRTWPDLDALATLVLVAETGSIGHAARRLGLSQPSLSRRLTALERSLGVQVLERSRRGTSLTPAGRALVDWATALLGAAEEFSRSVATLRASGSPAVRAAVSMTLAEHYAPLWLRALRAGTPAGDRGPGVALTVGNSAEVVSLVESGRAELGFLESPQVAAGLARQRIGTDTLVLAVAPGHPWAEGTTVTATELARTALLVREPGSGTRETVERALGDNGLRLVIGLELASNTALTSAAAAGMGPVALSSVALAGELARGRLVRVDVDGLDLTRPLTAVWPAGRRLSRGAAALLAVAGAG